MVYIDLNKPDREMDPGIAPWRIVSCEEKQSRSGDPMLKLKMTRCDDSNHVLYDNVMLHGPGWGIGKRKLHALFPEGFSGEIETDDLVGKRLWVETTVQEYEGKSRLAVDIDGMLAHCGYQAIEDTPPGKEPYEVPDDTPF